MRRLDRLPAAVIAGMALDLAGMLVFVAAREDVWRLLVVAPALVAAGAHLLTRGLHAMGAPRLAARMRWLAIAAALTAVLAVPAVVLGGAAVVLPAFLVVVTGLLHAHVWVFCVPFAHRRSPLGAPDLGAELCAGVAYGGLAACSFLIAPLVDLGGCGCHPHDLALPIGMMTGTCLWAMHWLAPRSTANDVSSGLTSLIAAASWGALGLVAAPFVVGTDGLVAWLTIAAVVAIWLAATAWQLRAVALGAAGLAALLVASIATASVPEPAIMATATLGWIAIATRAGAHRVIDSIAIIAGVALTLATAAGLSSEVLVPALRVGDGRGLLLVAAPTLLRSAYLAALALRAIRGVDDLAPVPVPRAIART
jgi:hypothetical protein